jgi:sphingosine kinase
MSEILYRDRLSILDNSKTPSFSPQQNEAILDRDCLTWQLEGSSSLSLKDAIGAFPLVEKHPYGFAIDTYPAGEGKRRRLQRYYFAADSLEARDNWLKAIETSLRGTPTKPRPRLAIVLNPASGRKQGRKIWQEVAPVFEKGYCEFYIRETTKSGELIEIISNLDLDRLDGLVIIGGDGTIYEALNGLLHRGETETKKMPIPIGVIPGGTSNGLAKSILERAGELYDPIGAAFLIVRGRIGTIDLVTVKQQDRYFYSILSFAWGLIGDVDLESDRLRFLGTLKTDIYVLIRLLFLRTYRGKLSLFEAAGEKREIDAEFILLWAMNVPWAAYNLHTAPRASLDDGTIDLLAIRAGTSRWLILWAFIQLARGKHIELPYIEYYKVRGFHLEPEQNRGVIAVDGEAIPCLPTTIEVSQGSGRIFG